MKHITAHTFKKSIATAVLLFIVILFATVNASAAGAFETISTETFNHQTRSILLIDRSGSMKDAHTTVEEFESKIKTESSEFDSVSFFDTRTETDPDFVGGGNSSICEAIDKAALAGFTYITVLTDGEQWPADYSSLGVYTDIYVTIVLTVEENQASKSLIEQLRKHLVNSSLKVITSEGNEKLLMDEYKPFTHTAKIPSLDEEKVKDFTIDSVNEELKQKFKSYWWLALVAVILISVMVVGLAFAVWYIIARHRNKKGKRNKNYINEYKKCNFISENNWIPKEKSEKDENIIKGTLKDKPNSKDDSKKPDDNIKNTSENIPHEVFKIYVAGRPCSIVKGSKHKVTEKNRKNKKSVTVITKKTYKIK